MRRQELVSAVGRLVCKLKARFRDEGLLADLETAGIWAKGKARGRGVRYIDVREADGFVWVTVEEEGRGLSAVSEWMVQGGQLMPVCGVLGM